MKNKKLTYLLIIVVLGVWGIIISRVVSYTASETPVPVPDQKSETRETGEKDWSLSLDYRDPFLEESVPRRAPSVGSGGVKKQEETPLPDPPAMAFKGVIQQGKQVYALLEHLGTSGILQRGDTLSGFQVAAITTDSVTLKKGKHAFVLKAR